MNSEKYQSPAYWTQLIQLMLYDKIKAYLQENNLTQKQFAEKLNVSKGYITQILNGDFDHKLSKFVELALACNLVPKIELVPASMAVNVAVNSYLNPIDWKAFSEVISNSTVLSTNGNRYTQNIEWQPINNAQIVSA